MYQPLAAARTLYEARHRLHQGASHIGLKYHRTGTVLHGDIDVRYYERGPADADLTVLYVHGFNISSESFYMQVEELSVYGVRQILVDYRGHGRTTHADPASCTVDDAAELASTGVDGLALVRGIMNATDTQAYVARVISEFERGALH